MAEVKYATLKEGTRLSKLRLRAFFSAIGHDKVPDEDVVIGLHDCFLFWAYTLLNRLKFLTSDQTHLLFEEMLPQLKEVDLATDLETSDRTWLLVVADGRYATWENHTGWLDLEIGETVSLVEFKPLEAVSFSLCEMYRRNLAAVEQLATSET